MDVKIPLLDGCEFIEHPAFIQPPEDEKSLRRGGFLAYLANPVRLNGWMALSSNHSTI